MIAHEPHDERSYVPLETYIELSRAVEALQATCREYQADAHAAMQYAAELRAALAGVTERLTSLIESGDCGWWNVEDEDTVMVALKLLTEGTGEQGGEA